MRLIGRYLRPYFFGMLFGFLIKILAAVAELTLPMILSHMIDNVVPTAERNVILLWGGVMLLGVLVAWGGNVVANRMAARVARNATEKIRSDLFARMTALSGRQLDAFTVSSLESRLTSDTYNVHQMLGMIQRMGVRAPVLLIGGILITVTLEPVLTLVLVSTLPLIAFVVWFVSRSGIPLYRQQQESVDRMTRVVRENAQGIRVIKALTKEEHEKERYSAANDDLSRREAKAARVMAVTNPLMNLFMNLGIVFVVLVGAYRVQGGFSHPGVILAFMTYCTLISNAMLSITRIFIVVSRATASAARIGEVLETPEDMAVLPAADENVPADVPAIEFRGVTFSYNGRKNDLENVSFTLPKGGTLGVIGPTGSGKSTLIRLLMRLYDPSEGVVLLDGRDVRTIPREELAARFGSAFQTDFLFADTIAENIDFCRDLGEDRIRRAAAAAQASTIIEEKEGGLAYRLSIHGSNLSGGQKQRLLIARALAGDPEILVLDDSTSALDYATDAALRQALREQYAGRATTVIVSQRISSILHADRILVLEEGRIIGDGTHESLLENCPLYREIADSQMGGAILD